MEKSKQIVKHEIVQIKLKGWEREREREIERERGLTRPFNPVQGGLVPFVTLNQREALAVTTGLIDPQENPL